LRGRGAPVARRESTHGVRRQQRSGGWVAGYVREVGDVRRTPAYTFPADQLAVETATERIGAIESKSCRFVGSAITSQITTAPIRTREEKKRLSTAVHLNQWLSTVKDERPKLSVVRFTLGL
jgi:hypothetical protein